MVQPGPSITAVARDSAILLHGSERAWLAQRLPLLTDRELEVLLSVCEGGANEEIASRLCVSVATVRTHLTRIHSKLGTGRKSDLIRVVFGALIDAYRTPNALEAARSRTRASA